MRINVSAGHLEAGERLVRKARANGGLAPLDVERFWAEQDAARKDPWTEKCPQVPLGIMMGSECVFDELGLPEDHYKLHNDPAWRLEQHRRYNDLAGKIVGRRLLSEAKPEDPSLRYPPTKGLHNIFEAKNEWHDNSYWLMPSARTEDELKALLDRVEKRLEDLRSFMLPANWEKERFRLTAQGKRCGLYRGQRGPVTFATSVYGPENLIYLIADNPEMAARFRDLILKAMLEIGRILDEEAGYTLATAPKGFGFADDNCALLNAEMYEFFGYPILKGVFDRYAPAPGDSRGQHSDSAMAHLLPVLGKLDLKWTNFGPTVMVDEIRRHLPHAVIHGQLAPFTFSRNDETGMVAEFLRDFEMAREKRGLLFTTAGSINNGSRLTGMRLIMAAIQEHGRYDR